MDNRWDKESCDLSPWLNGVINGEHGGLSFVYLFQYEISAAIGTQEKLLKLENIGKVGDIVSVRVRRKTNGRSDVRTMYDVKEMKLGRGEESINEIRLEKNNVFINVNMMPDRKDEKAQVLFDKYLGRVYDVAKLIPSGIFRNGGRIIVDILIKGDKHDHGRSYLEVVKYCGSADINPKSSHPAGKESYGLIRYRNQTHFLVWSADYEEELILDKISIGNMELGMWISFDSVERSKNGGFEIVGSPQPVAEQLKTEVKQGIVMILVNSRPLYVEDDLRILETEGASLVADSLHILHETDIEYPAHLWMEPEQNLRYLWRVSRANRFDRKCEIQEETTPIPTEPSGRDYGCIVTTVRDYGWIWSPSYSESIRVVLDKINNPKGKWVTFPEPRGKSGRLYSRGPVTPLNREPIKTRIRNGCPELEVTLHSKKGTDDNGKPVYVSNEVGDVGDERNDLRTMELPVTVWVTKCRSEEHSGAHWKMSTEYARRAPNRSSLDRCSTPFSTFSGHGGSNQEECHRQSNDLIPRKNTDELSASSTSDSCIALVDDTDGQKTPLQERSLASLCEIILENPQMSGFLQKSFGKKFFTAFASAVFSAETDE